MIPTHMIDMDETLKLTQGQGHKVKGQGRMCKLFFSAPSQMMKYEFK